jgi:hypothetical protein
MSCWIGRWPAINRGDRAAAMALAGQVLSVDRGNVDAEDLLTAPGSGGERPQAEGIAHVSNKHPLPANYSVFIR